MTGKLIQFNGFVKAKKALIYGIPTSLIIFLIIFVWACWSIRTSVKEISTQAVTEYSGDRVEALIAYMQSEKHSLRNRNRAIWALGRIGDGRAFSVLEKFHSGESCDHNKYLCQHELKKAINLCKGGLNICSWILR